MDYVLQLGDVTEITIHYPTLPAPYVQLLSLGDLIYLGLHFDLHRDQIGFKSTFLVQILGIQIN